MSEELNQGAGEQADRGAVLEDDAGGAGLAVLLLPVLSGKRLLVLGEGAGWGDVGAAELVRATAGVLPLPVGDGAVDVVLIPAPPEPGAVGPLAEELRRVLSADGFAVVRIGRPPVADALAGSLRDSFPHLRLVGERPFVGVFYSLAGTEDMAIAGDLQSLQEGHEGQKGQEGQEGIGGQIAFCGVTAEASALGAPPESLLIPLPDHGAPVTAHSVAAAVARAEALSEELARVRQEAAGASARISALLLESDELRETLLRRQDRRDESEAAVAALRRESARHLAIIAAQAEKLEHLERLAAESQRRASAAEKALADVEAALRRRSMDVAALERELGRVRQRRA